MEADFWRGRWSEGQIGFHEGKPNALLEAHLDKLGPGRRVLVPLCGKSEDLAFLAARGHQVVGVELVEDAVRAFFTEHGVTPTVTRAGALTQYAAGGITLLAGDFFATTPALLGPIDALYDRAAIIALPPAMRADYVKHLRALLPVAAPGLVVTVEYPQDVMPGPPFSVPEAEVRAHYAGLLVELLARGKALGGRVAQLGSVAHECCYLVRF